MEEDYRYWYLFCGSSSHGFHNLSIGFKEKDKITEADLKHVKEKLNERAKDYFDGEYINVAITSISYLGCMTDREFLND